MPGVGERWSGKNESVSRELCAGNGFESRFTTHNSLLTSHKIMGENFLTTRIDKIANWARSYSLWPLPFGTACCAIEFMGAISGRYDLSRFGAEILRFSPRQADLLLVMGTVSLKQAPILKRIYEQMPEPKWVVAFGSCTASGGFYNNYHTIQGIDQIIPVDVYVPGCPPRPEQLFDTIVKIQEGLLTKGGGE